MNHVVPVARLVVWCSYTRVMFLFYNQYLITEDIPPLLSSLLLGACSLCVAPPGRVITRLLLCYCISGVQSFLLSLPPFSYHPMAHVLVALVSEILHDVSVWGGNEEVGLGVFSFGLDSGDLLKFLRLRGSICTW